MNEKQQTTKEDIRQKNLIAEYEACIYLDCSPAHLTRMRAEDPAFAACWKARRKISRPAIDEWLKKPGAVQFDSEPVNSMLAEKFESML